VYVESGAGRALATNSRRSACRTVKLLKPVADARRMARACAIHPKIGTQLSNQIGFLIQARGYRAVGTHSGGNCGRHTPRSSCEEIARARIFAIADKLWTL